MKPSALRTALIALTAAASAAFAASGHAEPAERQAYYGDLHLHTSYSFDAYVLFGAKVDPDAAYRFARGESVDFLGSSAKRNEPLDFLAVTDHSENIGAVGLAARDRSGEPQLPARHLYDLHRL